MHVKLYPVHSRPATRTARAAGNLMCRHAPAGRRGWPQPGRDATMARAGDRPYETS